jgi:hypothetical protein
VLEPDSKGIALTPRQIQTLLQLRILPHPVRIADEPRILILSTQGLPMDLRLPSGDRQKSDNSPARPAKAPPRKGKKVA